MAFNVIAGIIGIGAAAFLFNFPFGALRVNTQKFSVKWFLYIHIPVLPVIFLRLFTGFSYKIIPFTLAFSVLGQILGFRLGRRWWFGS